MLTDKLLSETDKSAVGIASAVQLLIDSGDLKIGGRLPPIRAVARDIGVSPATVGQAWKILSEHGVLETRGRNGTFVVDASSRQPWRQFRGVAGVDLARDLSTGFPDPALLPDLTPFIEAAAGQRFRGYASSPILPGLRDVLADYLTPGMGKSGDVVLSTHVLGLLNEVFPVIGGYRTRVIVHDPEFAPYLDLLERAGMVALPVRSDAEGMRVDLCEAAIDEGASAIIVQPRVHNPTGVPMSPDRLRRIALLCAERDVVIIDSDYFGDLSSSPAMTAARWAPEQTLYIRSFAKDIHPDIRVVAAIGSSRIIHLLRRRRVGGFDVSGINQELLRLMLLSPDTQAATAAAKLVYDDRRQEFVDELAHAGIHVLSRDGFNVWTPVRSEQDALVHLASNGVSAAPGSAFQIIRNDPHIRVSIASMGNEAVPIARLVAAAAHAYRVKG